MRAQRGTTMLELVAVLAVVAVLAAVAVPGAAQVRSAVSGAEGARRLALVLRTAQAQARSAGAPVRVEVGSAGDYTVTGASGAVIMTGRSRRGRLEHVPGRSARVRRAWVGRPARLVQPAGGPLLRSPARLARWSCSFRGA